MKVTDCKYFNPRMLILIEYCKCLYKLPDCEVGGLLHILLDDGNYDDHSILWCREQCVKNPDKPESDLGILICDEYLKLDMSERTFFDYILWRLDSLKHINCNPCQNHCKGCQLLEYIVVNIGG